MGLFSRPADAGQTAAKQDALQNARSARVVERHLADDRPVDRNDPPVLAPGLTGISKP